YLVETKAPDGPYFEAAIIHHTECGSGLLADDELRHGFSERTGYDDHMLAELPVLDPPATVRADVERLLSDPRISPRITVSGHVYDVHTGLDTAVLEPVWPVASAAVGVWARSVRRRRPMLVPTTGPPLTVLEVIGTIGFAVSGAMAATRHRMDVFGVVVLGVIAATSGGTLRDLLLSEPVSWLRHWWPIALAGATAVATIPIALRLGPAVAWCLAVLIADGLALAGFSVLGCHTALGAGTPAGVSVIIGTISGITGGIVRDVLTGQPPAVFTGRFYALAAIAG